MFFFSFAILVSGLFFCSFVVLGFFFTGWALLVLLDFWFCFKILFISCLLRYLQISMFLLFYSWIIIHFFAALIVIMFFFCMRLMWVLV